MNKVVVRVFGGIGNQLFCYAAARRLALANDAELVIDNVSGFVRDPYKRHYQLEHFNIPCRKATPRERMEPFSRLQRYLVRTYNRLRPFEERSYVRQEKIAYDPRLLNVRSKGQVYLEGYWQGENYFLDVENTIRKDLEIIAPADSKNLELAEQISASNAIAVHARFFDDPALPKGNNAPCAYYSRAVDWMDNHVQAGHYFIFSDDPDAVRNHILLPDKRVTYISHNKGDENAFADLWLMSRCRHFIIANSSFSWWGAWLSKFPDKQVVSPDFSASGVTTAWNFDGLIPPQWTKLQA